MAHSPIIIIKLLNALTATLAFSCASISHSATPDEAELALSYGSHDFVSIATGVSQPLSAAPAAATVITADDIRRMGAIDLNQVLETVPGLHVGLSSLRFSPVYNIRGIHTDKNPQVLVLVNGTPITQSFLGDRGVNFNLPMESIRRIEIIRGPGSAVYGADAFSGVIDIITKNGSDYQGVETGIRGGSFDTAAAWGMYGTRVNDIDVSLSIEGSKTNGDSDRTTSTDAQSVFDQIFLTSASRAPGAFSTGADQVNTRIELNTPDWFSRFWNWRQTDLGVGPGLTQALDPSGYAEVDNYLFEAGLHEQRIAENWTGEARVSYMDINTLSRQTLFPAGTVLPIGNDGNIDFITPVQPVAFTDGVIGNPEIYEEHTRLDAVALYRGLQNHTWRIGAGLYYSEITTKETKNFGPGIIDGSVTPIDGSLTSVTGTAYNFMQDESRTVRYLSLQDQWGFAPDWNLTAGIRYDHYSDFGSTVNPRLALVWNTRQDLTTKLLYGRAFRAPSFAELFTVNNPVGLGNPDLDPETINTYELAFDYHPTFDTRIGVSLFKYEIDDLIRFVPDSSGASATAANTSGQDGHGLELELDSKLTEKLDLRAYYAFQDSTDLGTDTQTAFSPEHQAYTQLRWRPVELWELSTQVKWIGERLREVTDPRDPLEAYTQVNAAITRTAASGAWSIQLSALNLFDTNASEPSPAEPSVPAGSLIPGDYPLAGRALYLTGRMAF
ncbi:MAG: TonB-dependent receptor [Gammaproteobacteria bacterium]|nr:TonB-dependent receptor [Gammaproteobacteria bacterium]